MTAEIYPYNSLGEAARWLTETTGTDWPEKKIIESGANGEIRLLASNTSWITSGIGELNFFTEAGKKIEFVSDGLVPLDARVLSILLKHGRVNLGNLIVDGIGYATTDAPFIGFSDVRILKSDLERFRDSISSEQPQIENKSNGDTLSVFRGMKDLHPNELSLTFVGDKNGDLPAAGNMVVVSARDKRKNVSIAELGLADKRSAKLNKQGEILFAMTTGNIVPSKGGRNNPCVSRLRKELKARLGLNSDPFTLRKSEFGWLPVFTVSDERGRADERARKKAERKTVSLDAYVDRQPSSLHDSGDEDDEYDADSTEKWF